MKLWDLLNEAQQRAYQVFKKRKEQAAGNVEEGEESKGEVKVKIDDSELQAASEIIGITAIKYYDLR